MRTIQIPTSNLIKYIPSEPDGGVIPGKALDYDAPHLARKNAYELVLAYCAYSPCSEADAACFLDEELEMVSGSNHIDEDAPDRRCGFVEDGVSYWLCQQSRSAIWDLENNRLLIPDPFDALGTHQLSSFVRAGLSHIACCSTMYNIRMAVIKKGANLISPTIIESKEPVTFGPPCQHNVGWLIPWQSKSKGINIAWLDDAEMDQFIKNAGPLPK